MGDLERTGNRAGIDPDRADALLRTEGRMLVRDSSGQPVIDGAGNFVATSMQADDFVESGYDVRGPSLPGREEVFTRDEVVEGAAIARERFIAAKKAEKGKFTRRVGLVGKVATVLTVAGMAGCTVGNYGASNWALPGAEIGWGEAWGDTTRFIGDILPGGDD